MYDLVAGTSCLVPSKYLGALETLSHLPTMAKDIDGKSLKGSVSTASASTDSATMLPFTTALQRPAFPGC